MTRPEIHDSIARREDALRDLRKRRSSLETTLFGGPGGFNPMGFSVYEQRARLDERSKELKREIRDLRRKLRRLDEKYAA